MKLPNMLKLATCCAAIAIFSAPVMAMTVEGLDEEDTTVGEIKDCKDGKIDIDGQECKDALKALGINNEKGGLTFTICTTFLWGKEMNIKSDGGEQLARCSEKRPTAQSNDLCNAVLSACPNNKTPKKAFNLEESEISE